MATPSEKKPLLGQSLVYNSYSGADTTVIPGDPEVHNVPVRRRNIPIEPATIFFFLAVISTQPLCQQYLHSRISASFNHTDANSGNSAGQECLNATTQTTHDAKIEEDIQGLVSMWSFLNTAADMLPSMVMTMFLGSYSDYSGRKVALVPPAIGGIIKSSTFFLVSALDLPLYVLLVGTFIDGMLGGPGTMLTGTYAYIADISTPQQRMLRIVIIDLCIGLGSAIANISIGFMISGLGFVYPPLILACIYVIVAAYLVFLLPETVESPPGPGKACDCENFTAAAKIYACDNGTHRRWKLCVIAVLLLIYTAVQYGGNLILTFYLLNPPLCWNSVYIGIYMATSYIIRNGGTLGFIQMMKHRLSELSMTILGNMSFILYFFILAMTTNTTIAFLAPVFGILVEAPPSMLRTVSSKLADGNEQGALFAGLAMIQIFSSVAGNVIFNTLYTNTLSLHHGFLYFCMAIFMFVPLLIVSCLYIAMRREAPPAVEFYVPARKYSTVPYEDFVGDDHNTRYEQEKR